MVRIVDSIDTTTKKAVHNGAEGLARGRTLARLTWGGLERPDRVDLSMVEAARRCNEVLTTDSQKYGGCEKNAMYCERHHLGSLSQVSRRSEVLIFSYYIT